MKGLNAKQEYDYHLRRSIYVYKVRCPAYALWMVCVLRRNTLSCIATTKEVTMSVCVSCLHQTKTDNDHKDTHTPDRQRRGQHKTPSLRVSKELLLPLCMCRVVVLTVVVGEVGPPSTTRYPHNVSASRPDRQRRDIAKQEKDSSL